MKNPKYIEGEIVYTKYGRGTVEKVDIHDAKWMYFVRCEDGTIMWCHENDLSNKPIKHKKVAESED